MKVLPGVVRAYNCSLHRSIGMRPIDVKPKDELKIWMRTQQPPERRTEPAAVGDVVRVSSAKKIFDKGYLPNWSELVCIVDRAIRHPNEYINYATRHLT